MPRNPHSSRASTSHPNRDISLTREKERDTNLRYQIRSKGTGLSLFTTGQQSHQDKNLIPAFPIVEKLDLYFPFGYKYKRAFETHWPRDKETFQQNNRAWLRESDGSWVGRRVDAFSNASRECAHCANSRRKLLLVWRREIEVFRGKLFRGGWWMGGGV